MSGPRRTAYVVCLELTAMEFAFIGESAFMGPHRLSYPFTYSVGALVVICWLAYFGWKA